MSSATGAAAAISTAFRATSTSVRPEPRASSSIALPVAVARREVHRRRTHSRSRRTSSTRLTLSTNWAQSNHEIRRMLVITLRTVTFIVAWRWCSMRTISSAVVPSAARSSSSQRRAGCQRRVLIAQALEELDAAGRRERRTRRAGAAMPRRRPGCPCRGRADVGELVGHLPRRPAAHDLLGEAAEVLDEEDAEADRDRPELADRQRLDLLVGAHHAPQALRVETAVGVGDVRPGDTEDPRVAREMALRQLGQLAVVARGQVVADLAELLVDDGEVVDQPFGGRRDRAFVLDRAGEDAVRLQRGRGRSRRCGAGRRVPGAASSVIAWAAARILRVLLQPLDAEELRDDRLFEFGLRAGPPAFAAERVSTAWFDLIVRSQPMADPAYARVLLGTGR